MIDLFASGAAILKLQDPHLTNVHCVAHKVALCKKFSSLTKSCTLFDCYFTLMH